MPSLTQPAHAQPHINIKIPYIHLAIFLFGVFLCPCPVPAQYMVERIQNNGNDDNRMVWVIMGDGYTSLQMDEFHQDVERIMDEFFEESPWSDYKGFINIYRIDVISNESGADHPSKNTYLDTALDATYDTYGISRLLTVNDARALDIASSVPSFDAVMVLVNDTAYGGSGGATIVFSNHEISGRLALHEAGHLLGDLADEYETPYPGYPEGDREPNVTYHTEREYIPWKDWIERDTPLPTPDSGGNYGVGLYEGARYFSTGIYRPDHNCIMRNPDAPHCSICGEALVKNLYNYVDPIDRYLPVGEGNFSFSGAAPLQFRVELVTTVSRSIALSWSIDGVIQKNEYATTLSLDEATLKKGTHLVTVVVADNTSLVRNDPQNLRFSSHIWKIEKEVASGVLSGKAINVVNNRGIQGVVIESEGREYSTTTGVDGSYHLSPIEEGFHTIVATGDMYGSDTKTDIEVLDGEITTLNFSLSPLYSMYSISGQIRGDVQEGVTVDLKKGEETYLSSKTGADGSYSFKGVESGSYTIIPTLNEYVLTPPRYDVTVEHEDVTDINFDVLAGLCPAEVTLQEEPHHLAPLRELRNRVLAGSELGRNYTSLYYRHAPELTRHIMGHEEIRAGALELILKIMPDITSLIEGKEVILESERLEEVEELIDNLESYASPGLKKTLNMIRRDIKNQQVLYKFGVTKAVTNQ